MAAFSDGINQASPREIAEIEIMARFADNQLDRLPAMAQELVEPFERSALLRRRQSVPREKQHPPFR
jgi:hypothetical protein